MPEPQEVGDLIRYPISQFSSHNNLYQKYTPSSLLGRGLLDCHFSVNSNSSAVEVHPAGALNQFIQTQAQEQRAQ